MSMGFIIYFFLFYAAFAQAEDCKLKPGNHELYCSADAGETFTFGETLNAKAITISSCVPHPKGMAVEVKGGDVCSEENMSSFMKRSAFEANYLSSGISSDPLGDLIQQTTTALNQSGETPKSSCPILEQSCAPPEQEKPAPIDPATVGNTCDVSICGFTKLKEEIKALREANKKNNKKTAPNCLAEYNNKHSMWKDLLQGQRALRILEIGKRVNERLKPQVVEKHFNGTEPTEKDLAKIIRSPATYVCIANRETGQELEPLRVPNGLCLGEKLTQTGLGAQQKTFDSKQVLKYWMETGESKLLLQPSNSAYPSLEPNDLYDHLVADAEFQIEVMAYNLSIKSVGSSLKSALKKYDNAKDNYANEVIGCKDCIENLGKNPTATELESCLALTTRQKGNLPLLRIKRCTENPDLCVN